METILINDTAYVISTAVSAKEAAVDTGAVPVDGSNTESGTVVDPTMQGGAGVKEPLLASWPFVIGISSAVLVVSIVIGVLLAKLKIKKGIDLYED